MKRFDLSSKKRAITKLSLVLLGLAAAASISPVRAQDLSPQQAALETESAIYMEQAVETGLVLDLDSAFLNRETDAWHSNAAGFSPARQARIESCYVAAEAAYQAGVWQGSLGNDMDGVSDLDDAISDFYAVKRRKSQLGDCLP